MSTGASAFDALAHGYDEQFTHTAVGMLMRRAVWRRCAASFAPGSRILEMNCGTGEDALWLAQRGVRVLATDVSVQMLQVAQAKLDSATPCAAVHFRQLAWEQLGSLQSGLFDGALSNFGGLNCVNDLSMAARDLAAQLRGGAVAIVCIMGPVVPWEWIWYLARGKPGTAFRRLRRRAVSWSGLEIHYPAIAEVRRAFSPAFRLRRTAAIGALLPPPYADAWMQRHPRLLEALNRAERRCETFWPLPSLADHYLAEFELA